MELLALAPGWLDLDSGAVVEQQVVLQGAPWLREPGIKLQQVLVFSYPSSEPEGSGE